MKKLFNKKGFSLVELIIVIAIMAILVAVLVPVMIKWIEKSQISSDVQLADTVRGAFLCAATDARVLADPASDEFFDKLEDDSLPYGMVITDLNKPCVMKESVEEILGMPVHETKSHLKSNHETDSDFYIRLTGGSVIVTVTKTDKTGKKNIAPQNYIVVD